MGLYAIIIGVRALIFIPLSVMLLAIAAIVMLFLKFNENTVNALGKPWARFVLWLAAADVTVKGADRIPSSKKGPYLVVMNHQSNMDIPVLVHSLPIQVRFIGKIELKKIPVFGSALLKAGHILIDRRDHQNAMEGLKMSFRSLP